ncbi:EAL domain-containing protein [Ochrobactrum sp. EDr1-4]|uniref:EAL domain-containing protein n=1 Tax=Ochrobactrum sp. EDr1-4 TaxID=3368622 RepID=UPI003BA07BCD
MVVKNYEMISNKISLVRSKDDVAKIEQRKWILQSRNLYVSFPIICGAVAGYFIGENLRRMSDEQKINAYLDSLLSHGDRLIDSARSTLDLAGHSPYQICSSEDHIYLRRLLFSAYQVKDIGRLVEDRLFCSTLLGDVTGQKRRSTADVLLSDGTYVYSDHPLVTPGTNGPVLGKGNSNVVLSPAAFDLLHKPEYSFAIFISDSDRINFAQLYEYPANTGLEPHPEGRKRQISEWNNQIHAYDCQPERGICIALKASVDRTSLLARLQSILAIVLGILTVSCLNLSWRAYNKRDRSLMLLLSRALTKKELGIVYQPIVNVISGEVVGFEALIRWEIHPGDFVPPDVFIKRAEKSELIHHITFYVIDAVINEMAELLRRKRDLRININVSARDLHDDEFAPKLEARLLKAQIEPYQIGLELTERTAVDCVTGSEVIQLLRDKGHLVYIDDFGTGYSSLAYLGELSVDAIKIDKAFTRALTLDNAVSIIPQILAMARKHHLHVVAEGIETEMQAAYFREECASEPLPVMAQGWYFGEPVSAVSIIERLR